MLAERVGVVGPELRLCQSQGLLAELERALVLAGAGKLLARLSSCS